MSSEEQSSLRKGLNWSSLIEEQDHTSKAIDLKIDEQYHPQCHMIIERSYKELKTFLAKRFNEIYSKYIDEDLQIKYLIEVDSMIKDIKNPHKQNQKKIHNLLSIFAEKLELSELVKLQLLLYAFCELMINKTMKYSEIMSATSYEINEKII